MSDPRDLLKSRQAQIQAAYSEQQLHEQLITDRMPRPIAYQGFDADAGRATVQQLGGNPVKAGVVTNGAIALGSAVAGRQAGQVFRVDQMPRPARPEPLQESVGALASIFAVSRIEGDGTQDLLRYAHWLKFGNRLAVKIYQGDWVSNAADLTRKGFRVVLSGFHLVDQRTFLVTLTGSYSESFLDETILGIFQIYQGTRKVYEWEFTSNDPEPIEIPYPPELLRYIQFLQTHTDEFVDQNGQAAGFAAAYINAGKYMNSAASGTKNPKSATEIYEVKRPGISSFQTLPFSALFTQNRYELHKTIINAGSTTTSRVQTFGLRASPEEFELSTGDRLLSSQETLGDLITNGDPRNNLNFGETLLQTNYQTLLPKAFPA